MKIVIIGSIDSAKRVMAEYLTIQKDVVLLPLDDLASSCAQTGRSLEEGLHMLRKVLDGHTDWVVESANCDLAEVALSYCDELCFISSGVKEHVDYGPEYGRDMVPGENCELRKDAYSVARYRELFDNFDGPKREFTCPA